MKLPHQIDIALRLSSSLRLAAKIWSQNDVILNHFSSKFSFHETFEQGSIVPYRPLLPHDTAKPSMSTANDQLLKSTTFIIAAHGWLDNAGTWDVLAPEIVKRFSQPVALIAFDLAGHGISDHRPLGSGYPFYQYVRDLFEAVETMLGSTQKIHLLGHSMGGGVMSLLASAFPQRMGKLVLLDSLGPLTRPAAHAGQLLHDYTMQLLQLPHKKLPFYETIENATKARQRGDSAGLLKEKEATILCERGLKQTQNNGTNGFTWRTDPQLTLTSPQPYTEEQVLAILANIKCSTLAVVAKKGLAPDMKNERVSRENGWDWQGRWNALHNKQLVEMDGGHHLHLDGSVAPGLAQTIVDFLRATEEPTTPPRPKL